MIKKQEFLKILKEVYYTEERGILIYKRHLESAIFWTGIQGRQGQKSKGIIGSLSPGFACP